jgi:small GTP-binding protein
MDWDSHKVPIIGDSDVGKTSIVTRYTSDDISETPSVTVGVSDVQVTLHYRDDDMTINIWDTAGQERFRSLVPLYARGADMIILVFSLTDPDSFDHLEQWHYKIRTDMRMACPIILVGNKTDFPPQVSRGRAEELAADHNCQVVFTSARTGDSINELFDIIAQEIWKATSHITVVERVVTPTPIAKQKEFGCCKSVAVVSGVTRRRGWRGSG